MSSQIQSYLLGEDGFWVAQLSCGHRQHLRHKPPWEVRPWVMTEQGRKQYVGTVIECSDCDRGVEVAKAYAVRPADPAEMDAVFLMGKDTWVGSLSETDYLQSCRESAKYQKGRWWVLAERGVPISSFIEYNLAANTIGVGSVATLPSHRKQGHASDMLMRWMKHAVLRGARRIYLWSDRDPKIYERLGFTALPAQLQQDQHHPSICMVYPFSELSRIMSDAAYRPPSYF